MTRVAWLLGLASCDLVFGLDGRTPEPAVDAAPDAVFCPGDRDCDGVENPRDNCPDLANSDQADFNGDQMGDRCDPCSVVRTDGNDDDSDSVSDVGDNCPSASNSAQTNVDDADPVGDDCDPSPVSRDVVVCFHDFLDEIDAATMWSLPAAWRGRASRVEHPAGAGGATSVGAAAGGLLDTFEMFTVEVPVLLSPEGTFEVGVGVAARGVDGGGVRCVIAGEPNTFFLRLVDSGGTAVAEKPIATITQARLQLRVTRDDTASTLECSVHSPLLPFPQSERVGAGYGAVPFDLTPRLIADRVNAAFLSFSVYEAQQ